MPRLTTAAERRPKVPEIRKGDTVVVLAGKDAGKRGTVERVIRRAPAPSAARSIYRRGSAAGGTSVVVEGLNVAKRHTKPRPPSSAQMTTGRVPESQHGGILDLAQPVPIGRVMLVCPKCDQPTRIGHATLDNGRRVRVCRHCGEALEAKS
jgi:large subunit ribosomal protein L24